VAPGSHRGQQPGPCMPRDEVLVCVAGAVDAGRPRAVPLVWQTTAQRVINLQGDQLRCSSDAAVSGGSSYTCLTPASAACSETEDVCSARRCCVMQPAAHLQEVAPLDHEVFDHAVEGGVLIPLRLLVGGPAGAFATVGTCGWVNIIWKFNTQFSATRLLKRGSPPVLARAELPEVLRCLRGDVGEQLHFDAARWQAANADICRENAGPVSKSCLTACSAAGRTAEHQHARSLSLAAC
jgi:hypothetical protein